ncbi:MAG TPA: 4-hydroxy-3-methylbut-2-enyl diphosphate reductase [Solirubrobacterales bacterium]|nr:4-hydroxy-3-methylbut-2-enyl diphosphate reductase [Solirubrobacterales bacterium]
MTIAAARPRQPGGKVLLASPHGFCAGVDRAVEVVERALEAYGPPVYVRGEIIHSGHVISDLERIGARFVASEDEVPEGEVCILSAHGVAPAVKRNAERRRLRVIDATCPLVAKVHVEVRRYVREGRTVILIGRRGHEEVEGTLGEAPESIHVVADEIDIDALAIPPDTPLAYAVQTTLAVDDAAHLIARLRSRFTDIVGPRKDDICYASQNRQAAVKAIAPACDVILIAGARNSSNSNRLVEVARARGTEAHLVPDAADLDPAWLDGAATVGVGAGASAPRPLVDALLARLAEFGYDEIAEHEETTEDVHFPLPRIEA